MFNIDVLDWADPMAARGEELRATWARLRIVVDDFCATRVLSDAAGGVRDHVYVPAYPLAEWVAANWWFLESEYKTPRGEYERRHSFRFAGDGFAYPPLSIRPLGATTELHCHKRLLRQQKLEFLSEGRAYLPTTEAMRSLQRFIEQVIDRLDDCGIRDTALHEEWAAIVGIQSNPEELEFCRSAAGLGEDPYETSEQIARSLDRWSAKLDSATFQEICAALSGSTIEKGFNWIDDVSSSLEQTRSPWKFLRDLKQQLGQIGASTKETTQPWLAGYRDARSTRKQLGLNGQAFDSFEDLLAVFRPAGDPSKSVAVEKKGLKVFDGVVQVSSNGAPAFLVTKDLDSSKKFAFVRSVYDYLQLNAGSLAVATRSHSELQQASRAFAAEFLAPSAQLKRQIHAEYIGWDEISDLAEMFGVADLVIEHQIVNHRLAKVIDGPALDSAS